MSEWIAITVACARQNQSVLRDFKLPAGSAVTDAVMAARAAGVFPLEKGASWSYAIFGQPATLSTTLCDGDRVELLLPLRCDPKESRRQRASSKMAR